MSTAKEKTLRDALKDAQLAAKEYGQKMGRYGGLVAASRMTKAQRIERARKATEASVLARRRNKGVKA